MLFFISNTFVSNIKQKLTKNQANAKQYPEVELLLLFTSFIHVVIQKMIGHILTKEKENVCMYS